MIKPLINLRNWGESCVGNPGKSDNRDYCPARAEKDAVESHFGCSESLGPCIKKIGLSKVRISERRLIVDLLYSNMLILPILRLCQHYSHQCVLHEPTSPQSRRPSRTETHIECNETTADRICIESWNLEPSYLPTEYMNCYFITVRTVLLLNHS